MNFEKIIITTHSGQELTLLREREGKWVCPACGSPELAIAPWTDEGPSFEMCGCGLEFGFDDAKGGSKYALESIELNWITWRQKLIRKAKFDKLYEMRLRKTLLNLGVEI